MAESFDASIPRSSTPTVFNLTWEKAYFFTEFENVARCLICSKILIVIRNFNLQRHYDTCHANEYDKLKEDERIAMVEQLKGIDIIMIYYYYDYHYDCYYYYYYYYYYCYYKEKLTD